MLLKQLLSLLLLSEGLGAHERRVFQDFFKQEVRRIVIARLVIVFNAVYLIALLATFARELFLSAPFLLIKLIRVMFFDEFVGFNYFSDVGDASLKLVVDASVVDII